MPETKAAQDQRHSPTEFLALTEPSKLKRPTARSASAEPVRSQPSGILAAAVAIAREMSTGRLFAVRWNVFLLGSLLLSAVIYAAWSVIDGRWGFMGGPIEVLSFYAPRAGACCLAILLFGLLMVGRALRAASGMEARFLAVMSSASDAVVCLDGEGLITEWNRGAETIFGRDASALVGKPFDTPFRDTDGPRALAAVRHCAATCESGNSPHTVDLTGIRSDGTQFPIHLSLAATPGNGHVAVAAILHDFTERRRTEEKLRLSDELLRQVPEAVILMNLDGKIIRWLGRAENMFGWTAEEVAGRPIEMLGRQSGDSTVSSQVLWKRVHESGCWTSEFLCQRKNGSLANIEMTASTVVEARGRPLCLIAVCRDVTDRKTIQEELDRFFALSVDMFCICGLDGVIRHLNPAFGQVTGWTATELKSKPFAAFVHADDRAAAELEFERLKEGRDTVLFELRLMCRDGSYRWTTWNVASLVSQGVLYAVGRDVTVKKQAAEALRQSEERFRLFISNITDYAIFALDPEGRVANWNAGAAGITGWQSQEVLGQHFSVFFTPEEVQAGKPVHVLEIAAAKGRYAEEGWRQRKDGSRYWSSVVLSALRDESGKLRGFTKVARDITERKLADEAIQEARANLEGRVAERTAQLTAANEGLRLEVEERRRVEAEVAQTAAELGRSNHELEEFAYVASHDLQEPLRVVGNFAKLLSERYRGRLDANADDFLGFMTDGVARMRQLISDLVDYSRSGTGELPREQVECEVALRQAVTNLRMQIGESGAEVTHGVLPTLKADFTQLVQVFQNLIGNAIKYRGPEAPRIQVHANRAGPHWELSVTDNGVGVSAEGAERIFSIFERLPGGGTTPGAGVGLALCKRIVERHGGTIRVVPATEKGSTFRFTLPAAEDAAKEA
ncbi:MAG: PAS/PAC sensor signal transduction histidine [Planctomycetota bacterium]|nr:MAG: PAS/PAC sensor signal transduction histidine [Planctomycetota bacterium]